ncbi:hypothetical protein M885DRAFT_507306 [Pelagophyceae sp. CCMP2097]|nr:hypothetical protein M885DRAFT_507306 [Pelagophyceae sp. CCMP2097]|mmetsp:Transcript_14988/g.52163  ORF Transcript_14988/g.52163 Transcript_14988/m.52163 type:complete len:355 (-) Transcript_14988:49-1113(-)
MVRLLALLLAPAAVALVSPRVSPRASTVVLRESPLDFIGNILEKAAAPPADDVLPKGSFGVVITGGAAGVGYAYADEFLRRGHRVMICDVRDPAAPVAALKAKYGAEAPIFGREVDVSSSASVRAFAADCTATVGTVHHWVNNAGINGGRRPFMDVPDDVIERVVSVNLFGVLICTKVAMELMMSQQGVEGHIYNTVGSGVRGGGTPGYATYGVGKRGLPQFTDSLVAELEGKTQGYSWPPKDTKGKVLVHTLSPGMVFTDLLLQDSTAELRKFPFSVLAATPEEVAADLVPKILATMGGKTGTFVEFLSQPRTLFKFFNRFVKREKSSIIDDDGNVIRKEGTTYSADGVRALY